jgi:hypothetical protein
MEPKKEHTEHKENGKKVEQTTYDDPDTKTHAEEILYRPRSGRLISEPEQLILRREILDRESIPSRTSKGSHLVSQS